MSTISGYAIQNLSFSYPDRNRPALRNINLEIPEGEFVLVTGGSGSGKSTLARLLAGLLPEFTGGRLEGGIAIDQRSLFSLSHRERVQLAGMVFQDPERQSVAYTVGAEAAFGLENLEVATSELSRRLAEVLDFFGLAEAAARPVASLSGGQKQKLMLASVLAMQPAVLILDEPTSQLDPAAAEEVLSLLKRLNEELGLTVVLVEQRLERCLHLVDRVLVLGAGELIGDCPPTEYPAWAVAAGSPCLPPLCRLFAAWGDRHPPLTIRDGRHRLRRRLALEPAAPPPSAREPVRNQHSGSNGLHWQRVSFAYPGGPEVVHEVELGIKSGELLALLGVSGSGKSTLLRLGAGLLRPQRGKVKADGRVVYLAQDPNDHLLRESVEDEIRFSLRLPARADSLPPPAGSEEDQLRHLLQQLDLAEVRHCHPRDLSSGQRQRVAIASLLAVRPQVLLLDEPTRGLDYSAKEQLGLLLQTLVEEGVAVMVVTHDVEFAARFASRLAVLSTGCLVSQGPVPEALEGMLFYSTQIGKLCRGIRPGVHTLEQALPLFRLEGSDGCE